jgi:hypothetical protein
MFFQELLYDMAVFLGGLVVTCLPLDPRFKGSNLPKVDGFLRVPGVPHCIFMAFKRALHT